MGEQAHHTNQEVKTMDYLITGVTVAQAEPYLIGFAAGLVAHRFYRLNVWRFAGKNQASKTQAGK